MELRDLQTRCYEQSKAAGFHDRDDKVGAVDRLMLTVSELSEALEELRDGHAVNEVYFRPDKPTKPEGFPVELADALIRILDLAETSGIRDFDRIVAQKLNYNLTRGYRHGKVL